MIAYFNANRNFIRLSEVSQDVENEIKKELDEKEYQAIVSAVNKEIRLSEDGTLLFIEKQEETPKEFLELKKLEEAKKQADALEEQKQKMALNTLEMHEQALMEISQSVDLKGGETMVINIIVARIVNGFMEYKNVPAPIKEKVKQGLIDLGLEFLAVE